MTREDLALLHRVLTWALRNGWQPVRRGWTKTFGDNVITVVHRIDGAASIKVFRGTPDHSELLKVTNLRSIVRAVDVLSAAGWLPQRFSSAYAAGYREGGDEVSAMAIENSVEAQLDLIYSKFWLADAHRQLADLIEARPGTPPLAEHPFERREQVAQLCMVVAEFLGVDHDF